MSGLGTAITNGIQSATYNPEAEKARKEAEARAEKKKEELRNLLFSYRDQVTNKPAISGYVQKKISTLVDTSFQWLQQNPLTSEEDYKLKIEAITQEQKDIFSVNDLVLTLESVPKVCRLQADKFLLEKKITQAQKDSLYALASTVESFVSRINSKVPQEIRTQFAETKTAYSKELPDSDLASDIAQATTLEKQVAEQVKADENTFKVGRLVSETGRIALKVVGSLFILMLVLVSGMLTANDAIGRDPQYRIFYFIYGGLGFPFMLLYYLYRWFSNSAPHIYRLLPLYTQPADTSLMRFLFYPFTYIEDQRAIDAKTAFMTEAATLVGKKYTAPPPLSVATANTVAGNASATANTVAEATTSLGSLVQGIQNLALNTIVPGKKGANTILQGLQKMELA